MKERLKVNLISNMPISAEQKMQLRDMELRSNISTPTPARMKYSELESGFDYQPEKDGMKLEETKMGTSTEFMMVKKSRKSKPKKK